MKVALTVWGNRISPVFDSANTMLVAEIENDHVLKRGYERLNPELPPCFVNMMAQQGISTLICGAISQTPAGILEGAGIKLIPFISGNVETILEQYSKGVPITPEFLMPGCGRNQCRRRGSKEAGKMPRGDGTGPRGQGPGSGKGRGGCRTPGSGKTGITNKGRDKGQAGGQGRGRGAGKGRNA